MKLSAVFPGFNEEASIRKTVERALEAMRPLLDDFEILIVNDASRDATGRIADELAAEHPQVRVLHNEINIGQGASLLKGFREARHELITHNAMDYPFDMRDLSRMLPLFESADIVVAARRSRTGYTLYRKLTSVVNRLLLRMLFGLPLRDFNFVQVYRKSVLDDLKIEAASTAFLTPEIIIRAHDQGFRIAQIDIDYLPRESGKATSGSPKVIIQSVKDMLKFWVRRRKFPKKSRTLRA